MPFGFERRERSIKRFAGNPDFGGYVLKLPFNHYASALFDCPPTKILQYPFTGRTDIAQFHQRPKFLKLDRKPSHERLGKIRVRPKRRYYCCFRISPDTRGHGGNGIAMISFGEQRGFGKEFAPARRVQDNQMVIHSAADQAKPTAFDLVDCCRPVPLLEQ